MIYVLNSNMIYVLNSNMIYIIVKYLITPTHFEITQTTLNNCWWVQCMTEESCNSTKELYINVLLTVTVKFDIDYYHVRQSCNQEAVLSRSNLDNL